MGICISDYRDGDEHDPRSPYYDEHDELHDAHVTLDCATFMLELARRELEAHGVTPTFEAHVEDAIDPVRDIETVETELILADLATTQRRIEKVQGQAKAHPRDFAEQLQWLAGLAAHLNAGQPAGAYLASGQHSDWLQDFSLLTAKPRLYVVNVSEEHLPQGGPAARALRQRAAQEGVPCLVLCAVCEAELATWAPEEAAAYRADLGLPESGLHQLIHASYRLLDLITFFTITGGTELWQLMPTSASCLRPRSSASRIARTSDGGGTKPSKENRMTCPEVLMASNPKVRAPDAPF